MWASSHISISGWAVGNWPAKEVETQIRQEPSVGNIPVVAV
jgi:hypothetical protein